MQSVPQYVVEALSKIEFYCPACSKTSVIDIGCRFLLSPGVEDFVCPNCQQEFAVFVDYIPKEADEFNLTERSSR